jgi:hypothetical protein
MSTLQARKYLFNQFLSFDKHTPLCLIQFYNLNLVAQERFDKAAAEVKNLPQRPTNDELLLLYGLYKQATVGDNNTSTKTQYHFTYGSLIINCSLSITS